MILLPDDCLYHILSFCEYDDIVTSLISLNKYPSCKLNNRFIIEVTNCILKTYPEISIVNEMAKLLINEYIFMKLTNLTITLCCVNNDIVKVINNNYNVLAIHEIIENESSCSTLVISNIRSIILHHDQVYNVVIKTYNISLFDYNLYKRYSYYLDTWTTDYDYDYYLHKYIKDNINVNKISKKTIIKLMYKCFSIIHNACCLIHESANLKRCGYDVDTCHDYIDNIEDNILIDKYNLYDMIRQTCVYLYGQQIIYYLDYYIQKYTKLPIIKKNKLTNEINKLRHCDECDTFYVNNNMAYNKRLKKINILRKNFKHCRDFDIFKKMYLSGNIDYHLNNNIKNKYSRKPKYFKKNKKKVINYYFNYD